MDQSSTEELQHFLDEYARGDFSKDSTPAKPKGLPQIDEIHRTSSVSPSNAIHDAYTTAAEVEEFYSEHGFLPAPSVVSRQLSRSNVIQRFDLDNVNAVTTEIFAKYTRLANRVFGVPTLILTARRGTSQQVVLAASADCVHHAGDTFLNEQTICSHVMLQSGLIDIVDTRGDWRFRCLSEAPMAYAGQPLLLPTNDEGGTIPAGVICLLSPKTRPLLSTDDKKLFADIGNMITEEIQGHWRKMRRGKEENMRGFISALTAQAVVQNSTVLQPSPSKGSTFTTADRSSNPMHDATQNLRALLDSDFACILDLSAFHLSWTESTDPKRPRSMSSDMSWIGHGRRGSSFTRGCPSENAHGLIKLLSSHLSEKCQSGDYDPEEIFCSPQAMITLAAYLQEYTQSSQNTFTGPTDKHILQSLLPPCSQSHIAIPLFTASQPHLLALVSTSTLYRHYEPADVSFALSVAVVCLGNSVQSRLVEADAAKTQFVAMVSHELRTPLRSYTYSYAILLLTRSSAQTFVHQPYENRVVHLLIRSNQGLLSQLELIREFAPPEHLQETGHLLETAECCGFALRDVLNDVLDFGKMDKADKTDNDMSPRREYSEISLDVLAIEVLNVSYGRRLQWHSVTGELQASGVDVSVSIEHEPTGWWASVDVAGLRRVLLNLASNALKYTPTGSITLQVQELATPPEVLKRGLRLVEFSMADTGLGMSDDFKQNLFTPFSQEDSFSPGSGLGMAICEGIVRRMGGQIHVFSESGVGTTVQVTLLVQFLNQERQIRTIDGPTRAFTRRQISEDFKTPFHRRKPSPLPPSTPIKSAPVFPPLRDTMQHPPSCGLTRSPNIPSDATPESLRVLVVDDNSIGRKILTTLLTRKKVRHEEAVDGLQALEVFRRFRPHLVWTDVSMPIMDGLEASRKMRLIEHELCLPRARIIAITGLSSQNEMKKGLLGDDAALDEWLIKGQTNLKTLTAGLEKLQKAMRTAAKVNGQPEPNLRVDAVR